MSKKDVSRKGGQIHSQSVPLELASCTHKYSRAVPLKMCSIKDILDSKPLPGPNYSIQQLFSESVVTLSSLSAPVPLLTPPADIDPSAPAAARFDSLVLPATTPLFSPVPYLSPPMTPLFKAKVTVPPLAAEQKTLQIPPMGPRAAL